MVQNMAPEFTFSGLPDLAIIKLLAMGVKFLESSGYYTFCTINVISCFCGWGCRIHQLHLCRGVRPTPDECPRYSSKKSDGEVPVMVKLWGMWSTALLPSFPGPLWLGVVASDRVLTMGQIELNCLLMLHWIAWNRTVLTFKLHTYAKLNHLKWNCFCMLN